MTLNDFASAPDPATSLGTSARAGFRSEQERWDAVLRRDETAEGQFWFSVATTGVYCRPSCAARKPRRENVAFHDSREAAELAGFRPCKRCRPDLPPRAQRHGKLIAKACRTLAQADTPPSLSALADEAGLSPYHFHRLFKTVTGVTPKQYAAAHRVDRMKQALRTGASVTEAIYDAGYGGNSRFYEEAAVRYGMTATRFKKGGQDATIRFAIAQSWLGAVLVAATERGICAILFGEEPDTMKEDLNRRFPKARLERAEPGSDYQSWIEDTLAFLKAPQEGFALPLDVTGTAFQEQVWQALRSIPPGRTASYAEIAQSIGKPASVRAVAQACGANPVAVAIPCHRVVRTDGGLGGYRWGIERKRSLLDRERAA